jgi:geranylgeranylglycerol-phosphate geranylgeranyltransferase
VSARSDLKDLLVLTRPHNCLIAAASVVVGSFLAYPSLIRVSLLGASAVLFISAGGYALNDIFDVRTDSVNKPSRPLPSGRMGRRSAVRLVVICWAAGIALSVFAGPVAVGFAFACMILLWLYSFRLKSAGVAGPLLVSAVSSSGFVLGAALGGNAAAGLLPFAIGFAFHFAREVVKGAVDVRGDSRAGIRTLPVRLGERGNVVLCAASIAAVMTLSIIPFAVGVYGLFYLVPVLAIEPFLALCIYLIVTSRRDGAAVPAYGRVARILKAVMPVGLLAFLLGGM